MNAVGPFVVLIIGLVVIAVVIGLSTAAVRRGGRRATRSRDRSSAGIWTGGDGGSGGWSGGDGDAGSCGGGGGGGGSDGGGSCGGGGGD